MNVYLHNLGELAVRHHSISFPPIVALPIAPVGQDLHDSVCDIIGAGPFRKLGTAFRIRVAFPDPSVSIQMPASNLFTTPTVNGTVQRVVS